MLGAGLYEKRLSNNHTESRPIANNSVVVSGSEGVIVECISNSSLFGVGNITDLNGTILPCGDTDIWNINNSWNISGFVRIAKISCPQLWTLSLWIYG